MNGLTQREIDALLSSLPDDPSTAALRTEIDRLRRVCAAAAEYLESEDGPLYSAWEQGDIGNFDDRELTFEETIAAINEGENVNTGIVRVLAIDVYRKLREA